MKSLRGAGLGLKLCMIMLACLLVGVLAMPLAAAGAAKTTTVRIKVVMWGPRPQVLPVVDDAKNHFMGVGRRTGEAVFSDGRKAAYSNVFTFDMRRGKSLLSQGYTKMEFKDGSWICFKWKSAAVGMDQNGPVTKGEGTIIQGTGPYQGIKGVAKFSGRNLPPDPKRPKGASEATAELTYTLP
ncbi:MAG: hypothetical protein KQI62_10030 [Deltaproteobacteria bacterium]|nr:hypothetical protein [Deltaproteobacteria bacterium]